MNEQFATTQSENQSGKFKFNKKWFWIGIVVSFFNVFAGLVYGIALVLEKDYRKEGLIIIVWSVVWALIGFFFIGPFLVKSGWLPKFQIAQ